MGTISSATAELNDQQVFMALQKDLNLDFKWRDGNTDTDIAKVIACRVQLLLHCNINIYCLLLLLQSFIIIARVQYLIGAQPCSGLFSVDYWSR